MSDLSLIIRTADQTRKAEINISEENTCADVIQSAVDNWSLPKDTDYTLVNISTGRTLSPNDTLARSGVLNGNTLEIQPVLVAGALF